MTNVATDQEPSGPQLGSSFPDGPMTLPGFPAGNSQPARRQRSRPSDPSRQGAFELEDEPLGLGHLAIAGKDLSGSASQDATDLLQSLTGRFYTPQEISQHLNNALLPELRRFNERDEISICDPFAGDGRLVFWLLELAWAKLPSFPRRCTIELWEIDAAASAAATQRSDALRAMAGVEVSVIARGVDAFHFASAAQPRFDVVVTNPPWENLKPDHRELRAMSEASRDEYVSALKRADDYLATRYPYSQPRRKYAGWGTNLARVGLELSLQILAENGALGAVLPASFLADDASEDLRRWALGRCDLVDVGMFPAELRAFGRADVSSVTVVLTPTSSPRNQPRVTSYGPGYSISNTSTLHLNRDSLERNGYIVPLGLGVEAAQLAAELDSLPTWRDLEGHSPTSLWAGRELDETRVAQFLEPSETGQFVKGRMIGRFAIRETPSMAVRKPGWREPASTDFERIAWRDISRPSQKRRVQASVVPAGWVAGNSLGVAHFRDGHAGKLRWLLGVMSSTAFEFQLRALLATGHVTLASLRKVRIPELDMSDPRTTDLLGAVERALVGDAEGPADVEAAAFRLYGLDHAVAEAVLRQFPKILPPEREDVLRRLSRLATSESRR